MTSRCEPAGEAAEEGGSSGERRGAATAALPLMGAVVGASERTEEGDTAANAVSEADAPGTALGGEVLGGEVFGGEVFGGEVFGGRARELTQSAVATMAVVRFGDAMPDMSSTLRDRSSSDEASPSGSLLGAGGADVCDGGCGGGSDGGGHSALDSGVHGAGRSAGSAVVSAGSAVVSAWCAGDLSRASSRDRSGGETTAGETTTGETTTGETTTGETTTGEEDDEPGEEEEGGAVVSARGAVSSSTCMRDELGEEGGEPCLRIASARAGGGTAVRRREGTDPLAIAAAGAGTAGAADVTDEADVADVARPSKRLALTTALALSGLRWPGSLDCGWMEAPSRADETTSISLSISRADETTSISLSISRRAS